MKYSQQDVADMLNIDRTTYVNWENETTDIKSKFITQLAELFHVKEQDLFSDEKLNITNNFETYDSSIGQKDIQQGIIINISDKETANKLASVIEKLVQDLKEKKS